MASWTNATASGPASGVLRPAETQRVADLRREAPVSPALAPFVERYWSVRWDRTGQPPFRSEVLSHPSVNLSVEEGSRPRFGVALPAVLRARGGRPGGSSSTWSAPAGSPRPSSGPAAGSRSAGGSRPAAPSSRSAPELGLDGRPLLAAVLAEEDDDARAAVLDAALAPLRARAARRRTSSCRPAAADARRPLAGAGRPGGRARRR